MNEELQKNNYVLVKNFILKERALELAKLFRESGQKHLDEQVPNSPATYNFLPFLEVLCEKTPEVSNILKEPVLPTYCYARTYKKGAILHKHMDRPACEISLTMNLDSDIDWPIFVQTPDNREASISMSPGDAVLYLGTIAYHWRNEFAGEHCEQVFLHYVRSRGKHNWAYFDKQR